MNDIKTNSAKAWLLAARPKTLTGAIIPVMIGTALAFANNSFKPLPALLCLLFACGMQIAANFINDLFDYLKGSDRDDRLGPERACSQGWITPKAMKMGIVISVVMSCLVGCGLLVSGWNDLPYKGVELVAIGLFCVAFAFLYTTKLSYIGCGDLLVLIFFGLVPVTATYYVQSYSISKEVIVASIISGLVIDTLLVVNNYRDRDQDKESGKRTIVVRFGEPFGRYFYLMLGVVATLLSYWFAIDDKDSFLKLAALPFNPTVLLLPLFYLAMHINTWKKMCIIRSGKQLNAILGETSRNILLMGILLSAIIIFGS